MFPESWILLALTFLGISSVLIEPYDAQAWSLLAAKWIVPLVLFQISGFVFSDDGALRKLEVFCVAILAYLTAMSVFSFAGVSTLIFPKYILDESIGIHADRARGPFLQAVANGISLNILGLVALNAFRRERLWRLASAILLISVPIALIATRTRAVWFSAAFSLAAVIFWSRNDRLRKAALALCMLAVVAGAAAWFYQISSGSLSDRLADRSPVDFRLGMYRAGWEMFLQRPAFGWETDASIQAELARRISGFRLASYVFHNTYLELAVQHGLLGLGLYLLLMLRLFRLGTSTAIGARVGGSFIDSGFRRLWPVVLVAYLLNASAVVMNYQFVNGLLFTFAGILAAQNAANKSEGLA
jgi:O-antigen ligase